MQPTFPRPAPAERCSICGVPLISGYYTIDSRRERFCAECMRTRPRCSGCGMPVGEAHWTLHDGRNLCARCHSMAVYAPDESQRLYDATVDAIVAQLGLVLRVGVSFRLVDVPTMAHVRAQGGAPPSEAQVLGVYQRQGSLRVIYMLYGLPKLVFRTTVAHEYAHAWQGETCPLLEDEVLREGFAEWVAYHHLRWLGCSRAAEDMLTSNHPYRSMLESVLAIERRVGTQGVISHILAVGRGAA
ncbi:protein DA1 [Chloroflexia bacterium SDU3-3]|nr:protein DA1 [Chloroflexia bacterium SDU3-3]